MRQTIFFLLSCALVWAQPAITPSTPPVVRQGSSYTFSATGTGTLRWSLAPGSAGAIDASTGVYTAPATVRHNNVLHGCPAFANDHIYNVNIAGVPKAAWSDTWATTVSGLKLTFGVKYPNGNNGFQLNLGDNSTPTQSLIFFYTPENNGNFMYVPMPYRKKESGAGPHVSTLAEVDRHMITLNQQTCELQEIYADYPAGQATSSGCPTCTAQGGIKGNLLSYGLGHGVDAAGQFIQPLTARYAEFKSGAIKHAVRAIAPNGYLMGSCGASTHVWPAQAEACVGTGGSHILPYGTRARLKAGYDITRFSTNARIILQALKDYGIYFVDGGSGGEVNISLDEDTGYDAAINQAIQELFYAGITADNLEFIDESPFLLSASSGLVKTGAGVIPSTYATVIATDSVGSSSVAVYLQGVTVQVEPSPRVWVQAGTTKQFTATVRGTAATGVRWSISPSTGSISSSGLYTAPGTIASPTDITITATSSVDSSASASVTLTLMPGGTIRMDAGSFTDTTTSEGTWWRDNKASSLCNYQPADPWPTSDPLHDLYPSGIWSYGDLWYQYTVPNGWYKITLWFGQCGGGGKIPSGSIVTDVESQNTLYSSLLDMSTLAPTQDVPGSMNFTTEVTNGELYFVLRRVINAGADTPANLDLRAFKIEPVQPPPSASGMRISGDMRLSGVMLQ
jgi:hypothetical protein